MHFTCVLITAIDSGDLHREHESHRLLTRSRHLPAQVPFQIGPQAQQARFCGNKSALQFVPPCEMGEVAGTEHADALAQCPGR